MLLVLISMMLWASGVVSLELHEAIYCKVSSAKESS